MSGTRKSPVVRDGDLSNDASHWRPNVLVVDDEPAIADTISKILCLGGYEASAVYDANSALQWALLTPPQLLITDVILPGMNGVELAITIKRVFPDCRIMLFSGLASTDALFAAAHHEGHRFTLLRKPVPPEHLLAMVAKHFNASSLGQGVSTAQMLDSL